MEDSIKTNRLAVAESLILDNIYSFKESHNLRAARKAVIKRWPESSGFDITDFLNEEKIEKTCDAMKKNSAKILKHAISTDGMFHTN